MAMGDDYTVAPGQASAQHDAERPVTTDVVEEQSHPQQNLDSDSGVFVEDGIDQGALWHRGDPMREQRAMVDGSAWVDLGHHGVVRVAGPDRLTFLHGLTSQDFANLKPGDPVVALILSPHGHIERVLIGVDDGESVWVRTEPGHAAELAAWLSGMKFMMRVEVTDVSSDFVTRWVGAEYPVPSHAVVQRPSEVAGGVEVILPRDAADDADPGSQAGVWAWEALRIAAGVPRVGVDTDAKTLPNEIDLYGTHLDKGCYRGQETVARTHTLGRPPRRLIRAHLDGSVDRLPTVDSAITQDDLLVGRMGSSARHYELGPIGLGLVKRRVPTDAQLDAEGVAIAQEALLDPDVGLHVRPNLRG